MRLTSSITAETKKGEMKVKKKLIAGITVTMFLVTMVTVALPARVSAAFVGEVEVGIVGPKGWIQWDGLWEGAQVGRDLVNDAGGILGPDGYYEVVLVDIDEHAVPVPDPAAAIAELTTKLDEHPDMYAMYGGFRSEVVMPMEEVFLDYCEDEVDAGRMPPTWTICGAATDEIIDPIQDNYARYRYMFRATPMNATALFQMFLFGLIAQVAAPKLAALYTGDPSTPVPTYIIAENLVWCDTMVMGIQAYAASAGLSVKGVSRPSPVATSFATDIAAAEAANATLVIQIFSAVAGATFAKDYGALKPKFACIGINVESQMQDFYASVGGACEYEAFLATVGTQEGVPPMMANAKPLTSVQFWDLYKSRYEHCPIYTAWGTYDAIIGLNETSYDPIGSGKPSAGKGWMVHVKANDVDAAIQHTETLGVSDGFGWKRVFNVTGAGEYYRYGTVSLFKYTGPNGQYHDLFCYADSMSPVWPTRISRAHITQWQAGRLNPTFPQDQDFSRKWIIPTWMYSLETDFAGGPLVPTVIETSPGSGIYYNYSTPDGTVYLADLTAMIPVWFSKPPFFLLEADMQPQDHFIDIYDAARVGKDWDKSETPQY